MGTMISAGILSGLAGAKLGSYLGPIGAGFGAVIGFCSGCCGQKDTSKEVEKGGKQVLVELGNIAERERKRALVKFGNIAGREVEVLRNEFRQQAIHFQDQLWNRVDQQSQKINYGMGTLAFPILAYCTATIPLSLGTAGSLLAKTFSPIFLTMGWISGFSFFRGAMLNHPNVTFVDSAARTLNVALGTLIMYSCSFGLELAKSGTYDSGEEVSPIGRMGCGILSSLLMAGAFRVAVVSALDPNYEKTLSEENGKSS